MKISRYKMYLGGLVLAGMLAFVPAAWGQNGGDVIAECRAAQLALPVPAPGDCAETVRASNFNGILVWQDRDTPANLEVIGNVVAEGDVRLESPCSYTIAAGASFEVRPDSRTGSGGNLVLVFGGGYNDNGGSTSGETIVVTGTVIRGNGTSFGPINYVALDQSDGSVSVCAGSGEADAGGQIWKFTTMRAETNITLVAPDDDINASDLNLTAGGTVQMAAIAIPSYQGYTAKAKVVKINVPGDFVASRGTWEVDEEFAVTAGGTCSSAAGSLRTLSTANVTYNCGNVEITGGAFDLAGSTAVMLTGDVILAIDWAIEWAGPGGSLDTHASHKIEITGTRVGDPLKPFAVPDFFAETTEPLGTVIIKNSTVAANTSTVAASGSKGNLRFKGSHLNAVNARYMATNLGVGTSSFTGDNGTFTSSVMNVNDVDFDLNGTLSCDATKRYTERDGVTGTAGACVQLNACEICDNIVQTGM